MSIYDAIDLLPERRQVPSWFPHRAQLGALISEWQGGDEHKSAWGVAVELGAWWGESTVFLAQHFGHVWAVDHFEGPDDLAPSFEEREIRAALYAQLLSNLQHAGVEDRVTPVRMRTLEAALALKLRPDFVYVDADHAAEAAYVDALAWGLKLAPGGLIAGDDFDRASVQRGVRAAARDLGRRVESDGAKLWWFDWR